MSRCLSIGFGLVVIFGLAGYPAWGADGECGMFLSKSAGYEHSCIKWDQSKVSHVDGVLNGLSDRLGLDVLCTKDASLISADNLANYKVVIFYTTGDLTTEGTDGYPVMKSNGVDELLAWIRNGGGFVGFHCASDTFHTPENGPVTPFINMIGGEFRNHGAQFEGIVKVVDPGHPAVASLPAEWTIKDEWYLFRNFNVNDMHVLAVMDPGPEREKQEMYQVPAYPIAWCSAYGNGRVFYNAMGHREDVWDNPTFQQHVIDAVRWAKGEGDAGATPNFAQVLTADDAAIAQGLAPEKKE